MENYERHKSRDEEDLKDEESDLTSSCLTFPRSSSPDTDQGNFSSKHVDTSSNSKTSSVDDVTENDNDIVDVESVDDDDTAKGLNELAHSNSLTRNKTSDSHFPHHKVPICRSLSNSCST